MSAPRVIVVGGGISGIACARTVSDAGVSVTVRDRGKRLAGRMGVRSHGGRPVDIGASYFTAADPVFAAQVDAWQERGLVRRWTDTFTVRGADGPGSKTGPVRWGTPGGLRSLVEDLARGLDVRVDSVVTEVGRSAGRPTVDGVAADAVVLAMPDPQAARLLTADLEPVRVSLDAVFDPVLVLTTHWPAPSWPEFDGIFVNDSDVLDFVADDGRRRGDGAPVLVAHSTVDFARPRLDDPDAATGELLSALRTAAGVGEQEPEHVSVHRWSFAKPAAAHEEPYLLSDLGVGVCGDAWGGSPKVESAYLSGRHLGQALVARLG